MRWVSDDCRHQRCQECNGKIPAALGDSAWVCECSCHSVPSVVDEDAA